MQRSAGDNKRHFENDERTLRILRQSRAQPQARALEPGKTAGDVQETDKVPEIKSHWRGIALSALAAVVAMLVLLAALSVEGVSGAIDQQAAINAAVAHALASTTPPPPAAVTAYDAVRPALVEILAKEADAQAKPTVSYGTGVVINQNGLILTSLHIVRGSTQIQVVFADGSESEAVLAQYQDANDTAFLKPTDPPQQLSPAVIGNPHALQVGDQAIVVGNPMQLAGSLSAGVISGLERSFQPPGGAPLMQHMIQIDAAVNPGNSGGPLLNRNGEVVGIITGRASPSGQEAFYGIGFAVPIDQVMSANGPLPY